jgi:hypothetical protein
VYQGVARPLDSVVLVTMFADLLERDRKLWGLSVSQAAGVSV